MANRRNPEKHARKLDIIAAEAAILLAEEGPAAVLPVRLGRRIDGSGFNVPNLFYNGGDLLALVLTRHLDALIEAVGQPGDWAGSPHDRLAGMALAYATTAHGHGRPTAAVHATLPAATHFLNPAGRETLAARRRWLASAFEAAIADAITPIHPDPRLTQALAATTLTLLDTGPAWPSPTLTPAALAQTAAALACSRTVRDAMVRGMVV